MKRRLWTVMANRMPVAVVSAADLHAAWVIVRAMEDFDDLPEGLGQIEVEPCSDEESSSVMAKARKHRSVEHFLARLTNGQFVLSYGALSALAPSRQRSRLAA